MTPKGRYFFFWGGRRSTGSETEHLEGDAAAQRKTSLKCFPPNRYAGRGGWVTNGKRLDEKKGIRQSGGRGISLNHGEKGDTFLRSEFLRRLCE